mmetsp:Transcript_6903/g.13405  ORF Transcript_6903/g.13405 Transcript_6903/m.13405 type:complete len:385 (+) Transcript_6903:72-1226(+)|eukprot:CAMPEP_0182455128 /NCGR_PEP_ID=MMETSP1319-20130603/1437_1 /TAXON_ID=172717 /ORGANISM="Bolidomonas pacifica, Strain RCC208" /LENGTH=384 /DNA_ID=CAMNT_0024653163 /DNA_START=52 /DNA_END=1206 /DNA_ORIENTATION=+
MNFAEMQTMAVKRFSSVPDPVNSSDSSSDDDQASHPSVTKKKPVPARSTKSITADEEKVLRALLKKWMAKNSTAYKCLALTAFFWLASVSILVRYQNFWSTLPVAASIVRNFMILHDSCHGSFLETRRQNAILSSIIQFFSQFQWTTWRETHNHHHTHLGDNSVIDTSLTVWFSEEEYANMPLKMKIPFRLIRDPLLFFPIASAWVFFISRPIIQFLPRYVVPIGFYFAFGLKVAFLYCVGGWMAGIVGLCLFHLQHQVNTPYRVSHDRKSLIDAGLYGSTLLAIRWPFTLITLGIEFHHIHHASVLVPSYHLAQCHAEGERLNLFGGINRVGGHRAVMSLFHALFKGNVKHSHADHHEYDAEHPPPSFATFWPYSALGLFDQS